MRPKVYLETSIISYLSGKPSQDIVTAARQQITREWWQAKRWRFDLYVSEFVVQEVGTGDPVAAGLRMEALKDVPLLQLTEVVVSLAESLVKTGAVPKKAALDALHIAAAVSAGVDYLLTWNFKHIANAAMRHRIEEVCRSYGFEPCIMCTPEELLED